MSGQALEQPVEERLANYLELEDGEPEAVDEEQEVEGEENSAEEAEEAPEPRKFTLKRDDGDVEVSEEEALELARKGYDYTQKTQAVAEERRTLEVRAQALQAHEQQLQVQAQFQAALVKEYGKLESLTEQINQYAQVDWNAAYDTDPVQASKAFAQFQQLQAKRQEAIGEIQGKQSQLQQQVQWQAQQRLQEGAQQLQKLIPDWSNEKAGQVREAGKSYGFSDQELSTVADPRMVQVLHDAMQFRALQKAKSEATQKVADKPPVVKPGGKPAASTAKAKNQQARDAFRKSGRMQDAAAILERML